ncbi:MAG: DUF3656 domain-containing protein [Clostridioides sp.]|nr:DUF3656 domain-containing protein [Clostridioides sp.]
MNTVELLAPVGSFNALKAAVQNGANAVYLGGKSFSARASANNLDDDEIIEAVKYCHIRGVKVFITVNTLIKENELENLIEYIKFLYNSHVDALIIQDIGVAKIVRDIFPDFEIHASTQMVAHSLEDVKFFEEFGFKRVVLARELTIQEIKYICENTSVDIEVFVHGALCVCYSGACLMSSMLGNRSGNRGRCAQPCRQKYKLIDLQTGKIMNEKNDYLLSTRDLNTIENIGEIICAGVSSLKIEGRMKRPEYVATVVNAYRKEIDSYINFIEDRVKKVDSEKNSIEDRNKKVGSDKNSIGDRFKRVDDRTMENLYTIFNRKFTKGYLLGEVGKEIMNPEKPNNQGLFIGSVLDFNKKTKRLKLKLEASLKKGDGINLGGGTIGRIIKGKNISDRAEKGEIVEIDFVGEAKKGQKVFKTSDSDLMEKVQKTFGENYESIKIPVFAKVIIKIGQKPVLEFSDEKSEQHANEQEKYKLKANKNSKADEKFKKQVNKKSEEKIYEKTYEKIFVEGDFVVEKALKVALTKEKVIDQISKLGNTPYFIKNIEVLLDDGVSLPISVLNQMRRDAVELLDKKRTKIKDRKEIIQKNLYKKYQETLYRECFEKKLELQEAAQNKMLEQEENTQVQNMDKENKQEKEENIKNQYIDEKNKKKEQHKLKFRVKVRNLDQLQAVLGRNLDVIYYEDISTLEEALSKARKTDDKIVFCPSRIIRDNDKSIETDIFDIPENIGVLIRNWAEFNYYKNHEKYVDYTLNTFNSQSFEFFSEKGVNSVCMSLELSFQEIKDIINNTNLAEIQELQKENLIRKEAENIIKSEVEVLIYGFVPMMTTEYCPMGVTIRDCKKDKRCNICSKSNYALEDQNSKQRYRIIQDKDCRSQIYTANPICILDEVERLVGYGVENFRLDFVFENQNEIKNILEEIQSISEVTIDSNHITKDKNISSEIDKEKNMISKRKINSDNTIKENSQKKYIFSKNYDIMVGNYYNGVE